MIKRQLKTTIQKSLKNFPVVGILGSRQVGKTTLAKEIQKNYKSQAVYLDLELPSDLNKLREPELFLSQQEKKLVIIDEIQRMPELFPLLRALIDQRRVNGRFLILGSASPNLIKRSSESLAGRIIYHELTPFFLKETGDDELTIKKLWLRGGYPDSFMAKTNALSYQWRDSFIKNYLELDLPQLGYQTPASQLRRFIMMVAHLNGQLWNASHLANNLDLSSPTIKQYLNLFEDTFIVRQLLPYCANLKKRLIKSPKIYFRDSGLLHLLLGINTFDELLTHPSIGLSWENFIIEQILNYLPPFWQAYFFRTNVGAEIDLVLVDSKKTKIAIEIKYSLSPQPTKGFWLAYQDLACKKGYVVYPGKEKYSLGNNVFTLPLNKLAEISNL